MDNFRRLQGLVLKLILFLVWFDLVCFALILAGNIFQWSYLTQRFDRAFFTVFSISLGALAALAILHVVLTLNRISDSLSCIAKGKEDVNAEGDKKENNRFRKLLIASILVLVLIVGYQGFLEHRVMKHRVKTVEVQLRETAQSALTSKILYLVGQDEKINKLYFARDEMLFSLEEDVRSITLLIPMEGQEGPLFYQITPWDYDRKDESSISRALKSRKLFIPANDERLKFQELLTDSKPFTVVRRQGIRSFYPVKEDGELKLVLLMDTSRTVSGEYLMSRGKFK